MMPDAGIATREKARNHLDGSVSGSGIFERRRVVAICAARAGGMMYWKLRGRNPVRTSQ